MGSHKKRMPLNQTSNKLRMTLWKAFELLHPNVLYFTAKLTVMKREMYPYARESLWILFLHSQSQDLIYCRPQKNKQFSSAVVNHLFVIFLAELVRCSTPSAFVCTFTLSCFE